MSASLAARLGSFGLTVGGFYCASVATLLCPVAGIGLLVSGGLWLYGKDRR